MSSDDDRDAERWDAAQEGAELVREGSLTLAQNELEEVLEADPDNPYALHYLGHAHYEGGDYERALKGYVMALERAPEYRGAMVGAGHALRMLGRHEQALRMAREVLQRDMTDQDGLYLAGLIHYARGEEQEALTYLERFLETGPELEVAHEVRGLVQILKGDVVENPEDQN